MKILRWLLAFAVAVLGAGCAPLEPFERVVARLPAEEFVEIDGQRVHIERWGDGGPPLVMLHGMGASTYSFRELGPRLGRTRRVVAIDLNGFGYTERARAPEAYSLEGQTRMVGRTLDELGIRRADFFGHSYGGYLAMRLAKEAPERVRRLVLVSPALNMNLAPDSLVRSRVFRTAGYPALRMIVSHPGMFRSLYGPAYHRDEIFTGEVAEEYRRRLLVEGFRDAYRGYGENLDNFATRPVGLGDLRQPTLVVGARHDRVVPLVGLEYELESAPGVPLKILEESGHSSPEEEPEELARIVEGFLR